MKVAGLFDRHKLAVATQGTQVNVGDTLAVMQRLFDPDSRDAIGNVDRVHLRVIEVHDKFCLAETYRCAAPEGRETVSGIAMGNEVRVSLSAPRRIIGMGGIPAAM